MNDFVNFLSQNNSVLFVILGGSLTYFGSLLKDYLSYRAPINNEIRKERKEEYLRFIDVASSFGDGCSIFIDEYQSLHPSKRLFDPGIANSFRINVNAKYSKMLHVFNRLLHYKKSVNNSYASFYKSCDIFINTISSDLYNSNVVNTTYVNLLDNVMSEYNKLRATMSKYI